MTDQPRWPLEGVKVLDLGQIYNGPYAGFLLAHAGADVVKIDPLVSILKSVKFCESSQRRMDLN